MKSTQAFMFIVAVLALVGSGCSTETGNSTQPIVPDTASTSQSFSPDPILAAVPTVSGIRVPAGEVLSLAKSQKDANYDQAVSGGAEIIPVDENRSFVVWWQPEGFDPKTGTTIVSLGGHAGWATRDFIVWRNALLERGYAFLSVQWWFGRSLESEGYYRPNAIYGLMRDTLRDKGVAPGRVIFQAYSMGSANSYAITALDKWEGDRFFGVTIANSGVYEEDFPPNAKIPTYADLPYDGTNWILYCATHDEEHPQWNECEAMDETKAQIETWGGIVHLYIKDKEGGHGSFMVNSVNRDNALDVAETLIN